MKSSLVHVATRVCFSLLDMLVISSTVTARNCELCICSKILLNMWWATGSSISIWLIGTVRLRAPLCSYLSTSGFSSPLKLRLCMRLADASLLSPHRASPHLARKRILDKTSLGISLACSFSTLCVLLNFSPTSFVVISNVTPNWTASLWNLHAFGKKEWHLSSRRNPLWPMYMQYKYLT